LIHVLSRASCRDAIAKEVSNSVPSGLTHKFQKENTYPPALSDP
jgi:hypothetical protein